MRRKRSWWEWRRDLVLGGGFVLIIVAALLARPYLEDQRHEMEHVPCTERSGGAPY